MLFSLTIILKIPFVINYIYHTLYYRFKKFLVPEKNRKNSPPCMETFLFFTKT